MPQKWNYYNCHVNQLVPDVHLKGHIYLNKPAAFSYYPFLEIVENQFWGRILSCCMFEVTEKIYFLNIFLRSLKCLRIQGSWNHLLTEGTRTRLEQEGKFEQLFMSWNWYRLLKKYYCDDRTLLWPSTEFQWN